MLAPNGEEYVTTNLYKDTAEPVLSQALFDLAAVQVDDNTSDVNVRLDQVQTTDDGGGIEYFTVSNHNEPVNLNGFELRCSTPRTRT